jgi:hypothetical protein
LIAPLAGRSSLASPAYLVFFALIGVSAYITRHGGERALALATGVVAAAASLIKIHTTGGYVAWCFGFFLLGFLAADSQRRDEASRALH